MQFVSGLTTLFQSFFGTRLPVIAAPSYAYIIPITSIISSTRFAYYTDPFEVSLKISFIIYSYKLKFTNDNRFIT